MIQNVLKGEQFQNWEDVPAASTEKEILASQAALKFSAETSLSEKVNRVFNLTMALIVGIRVLTFFPAAAALSSTLNNMSFAFISGTTLTQIPVVSAVMALAPRVITMFALLFVIRKILAIALNCMVYPAVIISLFDKNDQSRLDTFKNHSKLQFDCHRIALNKSGIDYDAFTFEHATTKGNGNWMIAAGGNLMIGEKSVEMVTDKFKDLGFNVLYVNGPGVGRSTGWPTSYSIQAGQEAALQFLEKSVKAKKILLYGFSLGGGAQSEAIKNHEFKTNKINYLVWSDRTFDRLSNAASCMTISLVKPLFALFGVELDGIDGAKKLQKLGISHIVTQNNRSVKNPGPLSLEGVLNETGNDSVIPNKASLFVGLRKGGIKDSKRLKCYGSPNIDHNLDLPSQIEVLIEADIKEFLKPPCYEKEVPMRFSASAAAVSLIVCHGGPADHFATFAENLPKDVGAIEVYASGPALEKLKERGIAVKAPFSLDKISPEEENALAEQIAKACSTAKVVITDVGHPFDIKVQKALAHQATHVPRLAYYDNPEPYVPGGYSAVATEVMQAAQGILFANSNLTQASIFQTPDKAIDFGSRKKVGIGYYPINQAEKIAKRRIEEKPILRQILFQKNDIADKGQKILVYFGGNNEEYFSKALPAFLSLLEQGMEQSDFRNLVIVLQQHPGAKAKNIDRNLFEDWVNKHRQTLDAPRIIISDSNSDDAQTVADGALYYQTSMGPQFVLADIPTIQIGHKTYEDLLVRNGLSPSVTKVDQFIKVIDDLNQQKKEIQRDLIFKGLGIKHDWLQTLKLALRNMARI